MIQGVREFRLLSEFRARLALDLNNLVVATEAGSGPFLYSSLAAALAGARKVIAVAPDSVYATHQEISKKIDNLASAWGIASNCISVVSSREEIPAGIDIFLNLGFIRPLDASLLAKGSLNAVVSYMCEAWEYRPGDLDLQFCRELSIPVAGVNEDYQGFGVFESCGQLALKLLFEAGVEVAGCKVGLLSDDPFGDVIEIALLANSSQVFRVKSASELSLEHASHLDALVVASYSDSDDVLKELGFSFESLVAKNPAIKIIQFSGAIDVEAVVAAGLDIYPAARLQPYRMSKTLSYLGARPVLALHSLGLKVAQLLYQERRGTPIPSSFNDLIQKMID